MRSKYFSANLRVAAPVIGENMCFSVKISIKRGVSFITVTLFVTCSWLRGAINASLCSFQQCVDAEFRCTGFLMNWDNLKNVPAGQSGSCKLDTIFNLPGHDESYNFTELYILLPAEVLASTSNLNIHSETLPPLERIDLPSPLFNLHLQF